MRDSLGSDMSAISRQSSASYQPPRLSDVSSSSLSRHSTGSFDSQGRPSVASRRRGYMRPQGTGFAASAKQRESVLSLGSIAHLQYYFARTGLLDGKGAQLARKRQQKGQTLDLSALDTTLFLTPKVAGSDVDSSYASMGSSPDLGAQSYVSNALEVGPIVESPIDENHPDDETFLYEYDDPDPSMLPPTTSTYNHREKPLPKPPSIAELKSDLTGTLDIAARALSDVRLAKDGPPSASPAASTTLPQSPDSQPAAALAASPGWHEIQGMHILDVMTLAIRAAKVYYTSHDQPDRLDAIKPEKELRSELLAVMDVLKRMATRGFAGGMRDDEIAAMEGWIAAVRGMLRREEDVEAAEARERAGWTWLRPEGWAGREVEREYAFLLSMLDYGGGADGQKEPPLPRWTPIDRTTAPDAKNLPTPFLQSLQSGLRLVQLHNAAVRKSRRRFGAIPTFHTDTQKPYRAADNLRYWTKAAELRWEVLLRVDALGVVYNTGPQVWLDFEDAVLAWCKKVREEIAAELRMLEV